MRFIQLLYISWDLVRTAAFRDGPVQLDLNNPIIVLGLLIGRALPYLMTALLAATTKWLVFVALLRHRPNILRLCVVALAELLCFFGAITGSVLLNRHDIPRFYALALYAAFAIFPNLLLVPSTNHPRGNCVLKKGLYSFALGLIFLPCMAFVWLALSLWLGKFS
jgi:hypothetical protein